jgi:hypothetical protein
MSSKKGAEKQDRFNIARLEFFTLFIKVGDPGLHRLETHR